MPIRCRRSPVPTQEMAMSLLISSQIAGSTGKRRGGVPTQSQSLEFQIREYLKWVFIPKPKPAPVAVRPPSHRPQGGRS